MWILSQLNTQITGLEPNAQGWLVGVREVGEFMKPLKSQCLTLSTCAILMGKML